MKLSINPTNPKIMKLKHFLLIFTMVLSIPMFGSFAVPDDDHGDQIVVVDHDMDQSIVAMDVSDIDVVNTDHPDSGIMVNIQAIAPETLGRFSHTDQFPDDVGWNDRFENTIDNPPNHHSRPFGTSGGNPGWC